MNGWKSIDSAPRDGTPCLFITKHGVARVDLWKESASGWWEQKPGDPYTHWMAIPPVGQRDDPFKDAEEWGEALNEAAWAFIDACPEKSVLLFNHAKTSLRTAFLRYAEAVARRDRAAKAKPEDPA